MQFKMKPHIGRFIPVVETIIQTTYFSGKVCDAQKIIAPFFPPNVL